MCLALSLRFTGGANTGPTPDKLWAHPRHLPRGPSGNWKRGHRRGSSRTPGTPARQGMAGETPCLWFPGGAGFPIFGENRETQTRGIGGHFLVNPG